MKENINILITMFILGIFVGFLSIFALIEYDLTESYTTTEKCQEAVYTTTEKCQEAVNGSYNNGLFQMINYTQSTGGLKIIYNNSIIDSNVCEYCEYIQQLNEQEVK